MLPFVFHALTHDCREGFAVWVAVAGPVAHVEVPLALVRTVTSTTLCTPQLFTSYWLGLRRLGLVKALPRYLIRVHFLYRVQWRFGSPAPEKKCQYGVA